MKRFVISVACSAVVGFATIAAILGVRLWFAQSAVRASFTVRPGVRTLCIGSSHTGNTWIEIPGCHLQKFSWPSTVTYFSWLRLRELDRLGQLANIETVVCDLDMAGLNYEAEWVERTSLEQLGFVWRYSWDNPLPVLSLWANWLTRLDKEYCVNSSEERIDIEGWKRARRLVDRTDGDIWRMKNTDIDWDKPVERCVNWEGTEREVLKNMIEFCQKRKIRIVFFASPLSTLNKYYPREGRVDFVKPWMVYVRSLGAEFYDFRREYSNECFRDTHHLNLYYAYDFTKRQFAAGTFKPCFK